MSQRKSTLPAFFFDNNNPPNDDNDYRPFDLTNLQLYNPVYKQLFGAYATETTALDHNYEVAGEDCVRSTEGELLLHNRPIHFKFSPLLDPYSYMTGKSPPIQRLPSPSDDAGADAKVSHYCNAAYVDCFFNYLSNMLFEKHGFAHGICYYGSFVGVQRRFKVNVTDDLLHLRNSKFFTEHVGKLFTVPGMMPNFLSEIGGSRRNKRKIDVVNDDSLLLDNVECLEEEEKAAPHDELDEPPVLLYSKEPDDDDQSSVESTNSADSSVNYSSSSSEELEDEEEEEEEEDDAEDYVDEKVFDEEEDDDEDEGEDGETFAFINDFPCQVICMEKCDGTLDDLFADGYMDSEQATSAMMQVIMTLLAYQKAFDFTHNDLHTNNIMYNFTDKEYLVYRYEGRIYRVPTYGRIYKIIDFGRSIYTFQQTLFCSDSFFAKGDAATQYNFGPCLDPAKPVLEPNPSFDLCRLGVSIFDFVMDVDTDVGSLDGFQRTIRRWCHDDCRHNVLYKRSGDDRYPNFKLYKMIARTVHRHTPDAQLSYALFRQFIVSETSDACMDLDALPMYQ